MNNIFVFDTNIFLLGTNINVINGLIYTTPSILDEIRVEKYLEKNRNILNIIEAAISNKKLVIKQPSYKFVQIIEDQSLITGDVRALSKADKELLALALELLNTENQEVIVYTNDYSMENVCMQLNIPYSPLKKEGIKHKIVWQVYCPFCKTTREVEQYNNLCEICGSKLVRRPKRKDNSA